MQMQTRPEEWRARAACGATPCCPRRPSRPRLEPTQARAFRALAAFPVAALPRRLRAGARHRDTRKDDGSTRPRPPVGLGRRVVLARSSLMLGRALFTRALLSPDGEN